MVGQKQEKSASGTLVIVALAAFAFGRMTAADKPAPEQPQSFVAQPAAADEPEAAPFASAIDTTLDEPEVDAQPIESAINTAPRSFVASSSYEETEVEADEPNVYYRNCSAARAAGAAPIHEGEPGYAYHLDRDRDGVACE